MTPPQFTHIHIVGIAGVGTSAIATWAKGAGIKVTGSDVPEAHGPAKEQLEEAGITWKAPFSPDNIEGSPDLVVVTNDHGGIEENPEAIEAKKRGLRVVTYGQALGIIVQGKKVLAVAGTHGKTTTAAMLALILREAGIDPSWIVGSRTPDLGPNGHAGTGEYFVAEADEYPDKLPDGQPKFLFLQPHGAIITSIEYDHPDVFRNEKQLATAFKKFVKQCQLRGRVIVNTDYPLAARLIKIAQSRTLRVRPYGKNKLWPNLRLAVPGLMNELNATAAAKMAHEIGVSQDVIRRALTSFHGVARRFEHRGEHGGIQFFDDYAHHPTAIRMTIEAARKQFPGKRIIVIFQPHTFSRTKALKKEFGAALAVADRAVVTDIYPSREKPSTPDESATLAQEIADMKEDRIEHVGGATNNVAKRVREFIKPGDVVFTMGAGSIYKLHDLLF